MMADILQQRIPPLLNKMRHGLVQQETGRRFRLLVFGCITVIELLTPKIIGVPLRSGKRTLAATFYKQTNKGYPQSIFNRIGVFRSHCFLLLLLTLTQTQPHHWTKNNFNFPPSF